MTSVITGDIINSRALPLPNDYLEVIRNILPGKEHLHWEIFRGDSFQVELSTVKSVFWQCVYIKSAIKTLKGLDVRMSIGIGEKTYSGNSISEANGSAFVRSGEMFERLKKEKTNLLIATGNAALDEELNIGFQLALIAMDFWTPNSAEVVKLGIEHPQASQKELGKQIGIRQNTVSERQKRAFWDEINAFDALFRKKIAAL